MKMHQYPTRRVFTFHVKHFGPYALLMDVLSSKMKGVDNQFQKKITHNKTLELEQKV